MALDKDLISRLQRFGTVLTADLSTQTEPVVFRRDREVELLLRHLEQAKNASLILLGPSGVGKTAILHEFVRRIAHHSTDPWYVLETSTTEIMSGTVYLGEWQTRLRDMLALTKRKDRVVVFFNDVFNMTGAGTTSKSDENMADAIAPYVESGELVLIGECTPDTYRKGVEKHGKFKKLFTLFRITEQSAEDVDHVIEKVCERTTQEIQREYGTELKISPNTQRAIREFGSLYFPGICPPGGAISLIEHLINRKTDELTKGEIEIPTELELGYEEVIRTLESFTGIPGRLLDDSQALNLSHVRDFFESRVIGQPTALTAVMDAITLVKAGLTDPKKPLSVMFFVGPTGVGKTELAKALAEFIFGSSDRMIRFDMSEFKDFYSFHKLIGDQNAREDSAMQSGTLLTKVRQQPFSVILLDEIEKAHTNIFDLLLQLFDDGRLTDPMGRTTNFTQTMIIMTSNLGSNLSAPPAIGFNRESEFDADEHIKRSMEEFFRPEFINRIDRVVRFQALGREDVKILAQRELGQVLLRSGITRRELRVDVDKGVIDILVREGFSELYGARPLKRAVENLALLPIARQIIGMTSDDRQALMRLIPAGDKITVTLVRDRQTRRSDSITRGVTVVDPVKGRNRRLKPKQIEKGLQTLNEDVCRLESYCEENNLQQLKSELLEETYARNFWDDAAHARDVLGEIYRLERLLEAVTKVRERTDQLKHSFQDAQKSQDGKAMTIVAEELYSVKQHAQLLNFSLHCRDKIDRSDAFITISSVEEAMQDDLVGQFAEMYEKWGTQKGFTCKIVNEEITPENQTRELTLLIEGVAVYGLLLGEEGIHEVVYGKTSKSARVSHFLKVRVLPVIDAQDLELLPSDIHAQRQKPKGGGLRCKKYRSSITLMHSPSLISVTGQSELEPMEAEEILTDLLRAELYHRDRIQAQEEPQDGQPHVEHAVRRYTIRPQQSIKDLRTGVTMHNLADLWNGDLDEFLTAAFTLRERQLQEQEPNKVHG